LRNLGKNFTWIDCDKTKASQVILNKVRADVIPETVELLSWERIGFVPSGDCHFLGIEQQALLAAA
jgi:hypothetical protein